MADVLGGALLYANERTTLVETRAWVYDLELFVKARNFRGCVHVLVRLERVLVHIVLVIPF